MDELEISEAIDHDRRRFVGTAAMTLAAAAASSVLPAQFAATGDAIRSFHVNFPEEQLVDLRRRSPSHRSRKSIDVELPEQP
jgi:hypothetical protein